MYGHNFKDTDKNFPECVVKQKPELKKLEIGQFWNQ